MLRKKWKGIVRWLCYIAIMVIDPFLAERIVLCGLFNLAAVSAADLLREQPGWRSVRCWLRRIVFAVALFFITALLWCGIFLLFLQGSREATMPI